VHVLLYKVQKAGRWFGTSLKGKSLSSKGKGTSETARKAKGRLKRPG
jgi:hypothetical protein